MRLWRRRGPTRIPFSLVATVRGAVVEANRAPREIGPDYVLFPDGTRVRIDERGNVSVVGSVSFRLRAVGPNSAISVGGGGR